jgi:anti-sigma factor RsiW
MALSEEDRAALSAYLDGELDEEAAHRLETRLSIDTEVRAEYDALRRTWGLLDYLPRAAPSPDFTSRTLAHLRRGKPLGGAGRWLETARRLPLARIAWAAAVLLALLLGYSLGSRLSPARPEAGAETDETLVRHLRILRQWPVYQYADDIEFLKQLDHPDLFGENAGS